MTEQVPTHKLPDHFLREMLNPKSVCTFGANNDLMATMGSMQTHNMLKGGITKVYPIHPKLEEVQGFKAYKSVLDLPEVPDLAFIILPARIVPKVMEECGQKGVKRVIITSGGFKEAGPDGKKLAESIAAIAKKYNMRYIGPNCLGVFNGWYLYPQENTYFTTLWIYRTPVKRGNITLVSQSGTVACHGIWHANYIGAYIGKTISVGNAENVDVVDALEYLKEDPETEVIGLYIEEVKRGKRFIELVKEITPKKPIVVIYCGGTKEGARSINSHTGAIAGNQKVFEGVFKETGIITADYMMDFLYYLRTLSWAQRNKIYTKGERVGIITDSGGAASMMIKSCVASGLTIPEFSKELQDQLYKLIPPTSSAQNPLDITFDFNLLNIFIKYPKVLMASGEVDAILIYGIYDLLELTELIEKSGLPALQLREFTEDADKILMKPAKRLMLKNSIPIFFIGLQSYTRDIHRKFFEQDVPSFDLWDYPSKCIAVLMKYSKYRREHS